MHKPPLVTPDGRYFVVRGRLWRCSDPKLSAEQRASQVHALMSARRQIKASQNDASAQRQARAAVHAAKVALGERGSVWWTDGAPDWNRYLVRNTPYKDWYEATGARCLSD